MSRILRKWEIEELLKDYRLDTKDILETVINRDKLENIIWKDPELMPIMDYREHYGYRDGFITALQKVLGKR